MALAQLALLAAGLPSAQLGEPHPFASAAPWTISGGPTPFVASPRVGGVASCACFPTPASHHPKPHSHPKASSSTEPPPNHGWPPGRWAAGDFSPWFPGVGSRPRSWDLVLDLVCWDLLLDRQGQRPRSRPSYLLACSPAGWDLSLVLHCDLLLDGQGRGPGSSPSYLLSGSPGSSPSYLLSGSPGSSPSYLLSGSPGSRLHCCSTANPFRLHCCSAANPFRLHCCSTANPFHLCSPTSSRNPTCLRNPSLSRNPSRPQFSTSFHRPLSLCCQPLWPKLSFPFLCFLRRRPFPSFLQTPWPSALSPSKLRSLF